MDLPRLTAAEESDPQDMLSTSFVVPHVELEKLKHAVYFAMFTGKKIKHYSMSQKTPIWSLPLLRLKLKQNLHVQRQTREVIDL